MAKNALVVGGTSGIGLGIAKALFAEGFVVFVVGRREVENKNLKHIQVDLLSETAVPSILAQLGNQRLNYVVFSAATEEPLNNFPEIQEASFDKAMKLNVYVPFLITQALLRKNMDSSSEARVLFLTSRLSRDPEPGSLVYGMTKGAIETFAIGLNRENIGNVISSSIIPGLVDTEMQKRLREADTTVFKNTEFYKRVADQLQDPEEVGNLIAYFLCRTEKEVFRVQRSHMTDIRALYQQSLPEKQLGGHGLKK